MFRFLIVLFSLFALLPNNANAITCNDGYYDNNGQCVQCEAGYVCDASIHGLVMYGGYTGVGQNTVSLCPNGKTTLHIGATSINDCVTCPNADNVQSMVKTTRIDQVITNVCRINKCATGYKYVETVGDVNLFDMSSIVNITESSGGIIRNNDVIMVYRSQTNAAIGTGRTLQELCPTCQIGKRYILNMTMTENGDRMYLIKAGVNKGSWQHNHVLQITQGLLDAKVHLYDVGAFGDKPNIISDIQVREYADACVPCEPNHYCVDGVSFTCPFGTISNTGSSSIEQCKKTLSWDADNGLSPTSATCGYDTYISLPNTPEKTGYTFSGWTLSTE